MVNAMFDLALQGQGVFFGEALRMWRRAFSMPRVAELSRDVAVGTTPHEVVYEEDSLRLLRYRRESPPAYAEPVLFCYALVNRPYILDLQPDRSVVRQFLDRGFEVYLIDWGAPTAADQSLTLKDYVCEILKDMTDYVLAHAPTPDLHLFGYCMGGTMSTMFAAIHPELVRTLTLMAAPLDFGGEQSLLQVWTDPKYFDVDALIDTYGNCPAPFLQACFQAMKPVQNYYLKYTGFFDKMDDDRFVENYFAMEKWVNDNIPVAGETFREFVKKLYQRNELVRGEFKLGDVPVRLDRIVCPMQLLVATGDHLVPPAQSEGILGHVGSKDVASKVLDAGHVGLAVSSKAHKKFWPEATKWVADRSTRAGLV
jgi:polyhydroxyalkanoate synthase